MSKQKFTALALAAMLLAGCGGGDNLRDERDALQTELEETQAALEKAEAAKREAERAEAQRQAEAEEAKRAEAAAEAQRQAAEAQRQAEEQRRAAAEEEQKRLEQVANEAQQRINTAEAGRVLSGLGQDDITPGTVTPTLAYRKAASVTTTPTTTTPTVTTGTSGKWFRTSRSGTTGEFSDTIEIYSDVEAAKSSPFADSQYNPSRNVINAQGQVAGAFPLGTDSRPDVASGAFPGSTGTKTIPATDRGFTNQDDKDDAVTMCESASDCDATELAKLKGLTVCCIPRSFVTDFSVYS